MAVKNLLIICQGNICRSPIAEALFAKALPECTVSSAGLGALVGYPADATAAELMKVRGFDLSGHLARQVTFTLARNAELIFTMTARQRDEMIGLYDFARGRVFRLGDRKSLDVIDPYRRDRHVFEQSISEIELGFNSWLPILKKL